MNLSYTYILTRVVFTLSVTLVIGLPLFGQIAIGQWRDHLPYTAGVQVADAGDYVFCASEFGLSQFHKSSGEVTRLSKISGLSDIGFSAIAWSEELGTLVIAYSNTNVDIYQDGQFINIPDIKDKSILGNKTIHEIHIDGEVAYLACGFAIVVLDIVRHEILDTYFIGAGGSSLNVYDVSTNGNRLFAATEDGMKWASLNGVNLADFGNWSTFTDIPVGEYHSCTWFQNSLFAGLSVPSVNDTVYRWFNNGWQRFADFDQPEIRALESSEEVLIVVSQGNVAEYDQGFTRKRLAFQYNGLSMRPAHAVVDSDNVMWIADTRGGLVKHFPAPSFSFDVISVNGPRSVSNTDISVWDGRCYVAAGGVNSSWGNIFNSNGLYAFKDNSWTNIRPQSFPETQFFSDFLRVVVDPLDSRRVFVSSYARGIIEYYDDQLVEAYDTSNSPLEDLEGFPGNIRCVGVQIDRRNGNLWVSSGGTENGLYAKEPDGTWHAFEIPEQNNAGLADIVIDDIGQKWIMAPRGIGLFVYNDNGTLDNPDDDRSIKLTQNTGNGNLASKDVFCLANDLDGEIWVGTNRGISVFYSPENVFSGGNFDSQQIIVTQDGLPQLLLENESITAIAIDGANRKWIGTSSAGVFLLSEDGTEEIYHFTQNNSPLLSDEITAIGVDQLSGEVFFGTDKGIVSFRGTATWGVSEFVNEEVYAYPNPVEPDYDGLIAIKGLVRDADVKITDAAGNVVFATTAEGGQAIWDGNRITGGRAKSGVYLVFASNDDGQETFVTKILFIN